jgi:hypothetical protein
MTLAHLTHRRSLSIAAGLAAACVLAVPAAADAHKLPINKVVKLQQQAAATVADYVNGLEITRTDPVTGLDVPGVLNVENALLGRCTRRSAHKVSCLVGADGVAAFDDGYSERFLCLSNFVAKYKNRKSRKIRVGLSQPECGPAPEEGGLRAAPKARAYTLAG